MAPARIKYLGNKEWTSCLVETRAIEAICGSARPNNRALRGGEMPSPCISPRPLIGTPSEQK